MDSFFQSPVRHQIQTLQGRESFELNIDAGTYRGVRRFRHVGPFTFSWYQILGVENMEHVPQLYDLAREQLLTHRGDMFVQLGIVDELMSFSIRRPVRMETVANQRNDIAVYMRSLGLQPSRKEHMPLATIRTPLMSRDDLYESFHKEHRRYIRKAMKYDYDFCADVRDEGLWDDFYEVWSAMGSAKDIGIMSRDHFLTMMRYLTQSGHGALCVVMDDKTVVAGTIVAYRGDTMHYLYGATNRSVGNHGGHIQLQHEIMARGYEHEYARFDHRGVASKAYPNHHLVGVSRFKQRFRGQQIEYLGNMDIVHNIPLYRLMKRRS